MTKKDQMLVEKMVKKILNDLLIEEEVNDNTSVVGYGDTMFPVAILDKIEDFLGHPIDFMGIS
jgi:hypothetical protein